MEAKEVNGVASPSLSSVNTTLSSSESSSAILFPTSKHRLSSSSSLALTVSQASLLSPVGTAGETAGGTGGESEEPWTDWQNTRFLSRSFRAVFICKMGSLALLCPPHRKENVNQSSFNSLNTKPINLNIFTLLIYSRSSGYVGELFLQRNRFSP